MKNKAIFALPALMVLAACGGGGSSNPVPSGTATPTPVTSPSPGATASPSPTPSATPVATPVPTPSPTPVPVGDSSAAAYTLTDNSNALVGSASTVNTFSNLGTPGNTAIDGIVCSNPSTTPLHVHAHVTVINNGTTVVVPSGIGIFKPTVLFPAYFQVAGSGGCQYDIHIHSDEAVVHIESATATQTYSVKNFFDIWGQTLSANGFGPFTGTTRVFVTDESTGLAGTYTVREVTGQDLSTVPLTAHMEITVEVGPTFVAIPNYVWGAGL